MQTASRVSKMAVPMEVPTRALIGGPDRTRISALMPVQGRPSGVQGSVPAALRPLMRAPRPVRV